MSDRVIVGQEGVARGQAVDEAVQRNRARLLPRLDARGWQNASLLGLLIILQLGVAVLTPIGALYGDPYWELVRIAELGASFAPPTLLALWAVFGPGRVAVRLPLTLWLAMAVYVAVMYGERQTDGPDEVAFLYLSVRVLAYAVVQLPLWVVRGIRHWRLELNVGVMGQTVSRPADGSAKAIAQFSVRGLLGCIFAVAALLAMMRPSMTNAAPEFETVVDLLPSVGLVALLLAMAGLPVLALAWILLAAGRRPLLRTVLAVSMVTGLIVGISACLCFVDSEWPVLVALEAGTIANGFASLAIIAACGYRLDRQPRTTSRDAAQRARRSNLSAGPPLSRRRFALGLVPLLGIAAVIACAAPKCLDDWRMQAAIEEWEGRGIQIAFNDDRAPWHLMCRGDTALSDATLARIAQLTDLEYLDLTLSRIDDRQLSLLAPLTNLSGLVLCNCDISDDGLRHLTQFGKLERLTLTNTRVTDAAVARLETLSNLHELDIQVTQVTDAGLLALTKLRQLTRLDVSMTAVSEAGAEKFRLARPGVDLAFGASDEQLQSWLRNPTSLAFDGPGTVVEHGAVPLRRLHLRGKKTVADKVYQVTDGALNELAEHPEIEELDLRETAITDRGLQELTRLRALKRLDLRGTAVNQQSVVRLAESLPNCEILAPR